MKRDQVPGLDHISRYCAGSQVKPDGNVSGTAFRIRERFGQPEQYLSVNWLEFLNKGNREAEIDEIRRILGTKLNVRSHAKIAVLNVGERSTRRILQPMRGAVRRRAAFH